MKDTEKFSEKLLEELNCETAFTIPIFDGIPIAESTVVTWIIMAVLTLAAIILVRNLKVEQASKKQLMLETAVEGIYRFFDGILGEHGKKYVPYLATIILYLGVANTIGIFGLKPPTKDLNVTVALSIMSIVLIEFAGIHQKGLKNWTKHFSEPIAIVTPINILEVFIRPLSLCMRLFGNVLGAFVVMELIKIKVPALLPVPFSLYFDIFDGCIQAYVFVFLTSLFIKEAIE